jgi:N-acetylmuramoyl-L-alanine amidase
MAFRFIIYLRKLSLNYSSTIIYVSVLFFLADVSSCRLFIKDKSPWLNASSDDSAGIVRPQAFETLVYDISSINVKSSWRDPRKVTAIVLHTTGDLNAEQYIRKSAERGYMTHYIITENGTLYGEYLPGSVQYRAAPGMDEQSIHVTAEGRPGSITENAVQMKSLISVIRILKDSYNIPATNFDIISKKGIFTHSQSKVRYGSFVNLNECGGEDLLKAVLAGVGGEFYLQSDWKDRYEEGWILVRENPKSLKTRREIDTGRGFTEASRAELTGVVTDENGRTPEQYRLAYPFRGIIRPTCITLHYTALDSYQKTTDVLEERRLASQIIVDRDGRAFQAMDSLTHRAAAAYGMNEYCIHFEIVAKDAADILKNEVQAQGVSSLVKEVAAKYHIPLNNRSPAGRRGVFSHTQAKKKWGRSVFLHGDDYDPGEPYMKKIIEMSGGKYYPEPEWKDRMDDDWAILYGDFQP